ncbi:hypothetical protein SASPL_127311 [Salvia splendens]|uniref:Uncharacterized protein n=1 Tax=Salvia splendens TaxID=180675 RepID=A0A8X8ZSG4_SALSN|nr:hypothetical protein SASPL_127311 [Salvia splendens]
MGTEQTHWLHVYIFKVFIHGEAGNISARIIFLFVEIEKFTRRGCIGNVTDSKGKYCGHALVQVADILMNRYLILRCIHKAQIPFIRPFSGRRLAAPALDPALKLYKWLHDILSPRLLREKGNWYAVLSYDASVLLSLHSWAGAVWELSPFLENECSLLRDVLGIIFLFVEIEKFARRGCIGNATGICLPDGFGDDLIIEVHDSKESIAGMLVFRWLTFLMNRCLILTSSLGNKHCQCVISREPEHEKLGKIQLYINYSTTADESSCKCIYICSRNYSLRLCFGDCDERPTVSAKKLVATWFVEMATGMLFYLMMHLCVYASTHGQGAVWELLPFGNECSLLRDVLGLRNILLKSEEELETSLKSSSTVKLETFSKESYSCLFEIEKFTRRGCIGNVTGICLPDGFGDDLIIEVHDSKGKGISIVSVLYLGNQSKKKLGKIQLYINYSTTADESSCKCIYICSRNYSLRLCFGDCDERPTVSAKKKLVATCGLGKWYAVLSYDASVRLCLHSWARSCMGAPPFYENECSLLRDVLGVIFMFVEIEKFTRRGCIGNVTDGFGDDLIIEVHDSKGKYCGHARVQVADISDESGNKHCQCFISREPEQEKAGKNTAIHQTIQPLQMKVVARYLSYVMDISTATVDYLDVVHDFLIECLDCFTDQLMNIKDVFGPATGLAAPALDPALKLYKWLHDILSPSFKKVDKVTDSTSTAGSDLKVRLESIESVTKILEEANKPILPAGTGDLFGALKGLEKSGKGILSDALKSLGDTKSICLSLPYIILSNAEIGIEGCRDLFKWLSRRQLAGLVSSLDEIKLLKPTASAITDKLAGGCKAAEACFNEILRGFMDKKRKRLKPYGALQDNYESGRSVSSRSSDLNRGHSLVKIMQVIAIATTEGFKNEAKNMLVASGDIEHTYVPTQHLIRLV